MKLLAGSSSPMAIMMVVSAGVMWAGSGLGAQNVYCLLYTSCITVAAAAFPASIDAKYVQCISISPMIP